MSHGLDIGTLLLRMALGITMLAHGYNHAFGGGKLAGTARWFDSIGIRPGRVHALLATLTELGVAPLLFLGLLTPLAAAGVLGVMVVALIANHLKNGYFIFRPGEGYEYVLFITFAAAALGALGAGAWSLDRVLVDHSVPGCRWLSGWHGLVVAGGAGAGGAALLLATCWRPGRQQ
ncbi:MAG TPA: DoxX family protein [Mycobacteriales bacterium]|nr:DoxX family protein [Mycobacteriales bacterium]